MSAQVEVFAQDYPPDKFVTSEKFEFAEDASSSDTGISEDDEHYISDKPSKQPKTPLQKKLEKLATFESLPSKEHHEQFFKTCVDILLKEAVFDATSRENRVVDWCNPEDLENHLDFKLYNSGSTHEELIDLLQKTIKYSVKTGHPYFVNQLFSSLDPYGLIGQWLTDALNPSVYTYEVSPVFTFMEEIVLREMRMIVGFEGGKGDGIFCPGGSLANGYAISCARYKFMPDIKVSINIL